VLSSRWVVAVVGLIAVVTVAIGVWGAATTMSHGVLWGCLQGLKAMYIFLTWVWIVGLFVAGGALLVVGGREISSHRS
jgi:hypothetical protein